jgi:hypothetical protein
VHVEAVLLLYHLVDKEVQEVLSQVLCLFGYKKQREHKKELQLSLRHNINF